MVPPDAKLLTREVLLAFWKVHILHHAEEGRIFGQWVLTELRRHGYDISPGTLYPLLSRMERNGWLRREPNAGGGPRDRRYYRLTPAGAAVLRVLRAAVVELHHEVVEEASPAGKRPPVSDHLPARRPERTPSVSRSRSAPRTRPRRLR
jgi:PadR family transcriptional regulator, regulatory protein PadR